MVLSVRNPSAWFGFSRSDEKRNIVRALIFFCAMVMGYGAGPPEADHAAVASGKHTRRLKIAPFAATAQSNPPRRRRITHQPHECECKDLSASLPIASFPCANLMIRGHLRRHQGPRSSSWTLAITSTETSKVWFFLPSSGRHDRRAKHLCRALFLHGLISLDENLARLRKKKNLANQGTSNSGSPPFSS